MSQLEPIQKHLLDIERVIAELEQFRSGKTLADLLADRTLQLVFEREFEVLGEAMNRLLRADPALEASISQARRIIGLRNILSHGYDSIDYRILWAAACEHLPLLRGQIDELARRRG
jgi:uncharacterized protein with HEPN domain